METHRHVLKLILRHAVVGFFCQDEELSLESCKQDHFFGISPTGNNYINSAISNVTA
jgi:hypothetical protein